MKLWHGLFILTFIIIYGTLALALLGSSIYQTARSLVGARRLRSDPWLRGLRQEFSSTSIRSPSGSC